MRTIWFPLVAYYLASLLSPGCPQEAGPLPEFTLKGVALHPKNLSFAPTGELEHPSLIRTEGRIGSPLGKYYLYYSPHKHAGISLAYSDSIEGPWTEYRGNPVIKDAAIPDIRWIGDRGRFHLWGHRKNSMTEMWTSDDGIRFEHRGASVTAGNIGTRNATYTRVYEYPLERYGSKYIMLYSGFVEERGIRCVWLAHSRDAETWVQLKTPLVEPIEGENNDIYCASLLRWQDRNFIVYQDHSSWRGGNIKYVELDGELNPAGNKDKRYVLKVQDPAPDSPPSERYRGGEFYLENDTLYLYSGASDKPRIIVYATAPAAMSAPDTVFQYAVPAVTEKGEKTAFLWVPPQAAAIRGVVMGGMTLAEREAARDERLRRACADEQLAIVFLKCGLGAADLQKVLDDLAEASGFRELSTAPLLFLGHSAGGPQAKACAVRMAARCFGLVLYRGGGPGGDEPAPPGVPTLMMLGQFDEFGGTMRDEAGRESWEGGRDALASWRARDERHLGSLAVEPGAGHFAWSDRNAAYLALFVRKAARARLPADPREPAALKEIDPRGGWLTGLDLRAGEKGEAAPCDTYRGDRTRAAWHIDREMAEATVAYHAGAFGRKDQFIAWKDPCWVDAGARFFFTDLKWIGDGQTFEVHPAYADAYPSAPKGAGPRWPGTGQPAGHSTASILVRPVSGPLVSTGPNTLRIRYDALAPATEASRATFLAYSEGDAEYRYTEQVGMMPRNFRGLTKGKDQAITFPPIGDLRTDSPPVELKASSDSGLPVEYYVAWGPARIEDGRLRIAGLPARAAFPVPVKIVACQFGRGVEPFVKTAAPVEQTIRILKP